LRSIRGFETFDKGEKPQEFLPDFARKILAENLKVEEFLQCGYKNKYYGFMSVSCTLRY
jgi:hypothetical protein